MSPVKVLELESRAFALNHATFCVSQYNKTKDEKWLDVAQVLFDIAKIHKNNVNDEVYCNDKIRKLAASVILGKTEKQ